MPAQDPKAEPPRDPAGLEPRRAALAIVKAALDHRGGLEEALSAPAFLRLDVRDRGFTRALAMTVLRRKGALDRLLQARLAKPPPDPVLALLSVGAAQLLHMEVPSHAAVDTTVELAAGEQATAPFKSLINAVLRGIGRDGPPQTPSEALAPHWLNARWRSA